MIEKIESNFEVIDESFQERTYEIKEKEEILNRLQKAIQLLEKDNEIESLLDKDSKFIKSEIDDKKKNLKYELNEIKNAILSEKESLLQDKNIIMELENIGVDLTDSLIHLGQKEKVFEDSLTKIGKLEEILTMNNSEELAIIEEMESKGELEVNVETSTFNEPDFYSERLPNDGNFINGDTLRYVPEKIEIKKELEKYGYSYVEYHNNQPDFKPFSKHETKWGLLECEVQIGHMTQYRENPTYEYGRRSKSQKYDLTADVGNYAQADRALAEKIIKKNPKLIEFDRNSKEYEDAFHSLCKEVTQYRKENQLTWHEEKDLKTMLLIPNAIHKIPHTGGVSISKTLSNFGDITKKYD